MRKSKKKTKKTKKVEGYLQRFVNLGLMGYTAASGAGRYRDYRNSDLWKSIRRRQLRKKRECYGCLGLATQVHHRSYDLPTLKGESSANLVSVCRKCHYEISVRIPYAEGEEGRKAIPVNESNRRLEEKHVAAMASREVDAIAGERPADTRNTQPEEAITRRDGRVTLQGHHIDRILVNGRLTKAQCKLLHVSKKCDVWQRLLGKHIAFSVYEQLKKMAKKAIGEEPPWSPSAADVVHVRSVCVRRGIKFQDNREVWTFGVASRNRHFSWNKKTGAWRFRNLTGKLKAVDAVLGLAIQHVLG